MTQMTRERTASGRRAPADRRHSGQRAAKHLVAAPAPTVAGTPVGQFQGVLHELSKWLYSTNKMHSGVVLGNGTVSPTVGKNTRASSNPQSAALDSVLASDLMRELSTLLSHLNAAVGKSRQSSHTPRELLLDLAGCIKRCLMAALPPAAEASAPGAQERHFASLITTHSVPVDVMTKGVFFLTFASVKLRIELLIAQLEARVDQESAACMAEEMASARTSPRGANERALMEAARATHKEEIAALQVTETLLRDVANIYENLLVTFAICAGNAPLLGGLTVSTSVPGAAAKRGKVAAATTVANHGPEEVLRVISDLYTRLGRWILFTESASTVPPMTRTKVVAMDTEKGVVTLRRATLKSPWGLLFNENGQLIGVDVPLRNRTLAGEQLHQLIARERAVQLSAVNGVSLVTQAPAEEQSRRGPSVGTADPAPPQSDASALVTLQDQFRRGMDLTLQYTVAASLHHRGATGDVQEILFKIHEQGGEGSTGQRVTLVLRRADVAASWGLTFDADLFFVAHESHGVAEATRRQRRDSSSAASRRISGGLSDASVAFFIAHQRRLRMLAVNGVRVATPQQMVGLTKGIEMVELELIVCTRPAAVPPPPPPPPPTPPSPVTRQAAPEPTRAERALVPAAATPSTPAPSRKPAKAVMAAAKAPPVESIDDIISAIVHAERDRFFTPEELKAYLSSKAASDSSAPPASATARSVPSALPPAATPANVVKAPSERAASSSTKRTTRPNAESSVKSKPAVVAETSPQSSSGVAATPAVAEFTSATGQLPSTTSLPFPNGIVADSFHGNELVLSRKSADVPWGLKLSISNQGKPDMEVRLLELPPVMGRDVRRQHFVFKKFYGMQPHTVDSVNKVPASSVEQMIGAMQKALNLRILLRPR